MTDPSCEVKIALEVPPQTLRDFPNGVFDCTKLVESQLVDPSHLFAHDLVGGTGRLDSGDLQTGRLDSRDIQTGEHDFNHTAVQVLWETLQEAVRTLGSLPWGRALDRLESPRSEFRQYADMVLNATTSTGGPAVRTDQVGPVSLEDIRFKMKRE